VELSDWFERAPTDDSMLYFEVALTADHSPIGEVLLHDLDRHAGRACVHAHLFRHESRAHGHGEFALKAIVEYAFRHAKLRELALRVRQGNFAARRCYAKCGFQQVDQEDATEPQMVMCLTRDEWRRMVEEEGW
jgi:RimJ/RimL family protein N-acetyltransferase